jgi:cytochrome c biogenesis protein CcmG/thiol:disulfide interchange protein DsbE
VWHAYGVEADIRHGLIAHTPALFVIGPDGREAKLYVTQQSYSAIGQLGQLLAQEASRLLPDHPAVESHLSYARVPGIAPTATASLPRAGGGRVTLGPGGPGHLSVFFATWDQEVTSLGGHLAALNAYARTARADGLPPLTGVDEAAVEPSPTALSGFLHRLGAPLGYPVAIDATGRLADGYEVQGAPWFVLTSPAGHILWYREVDTQGWPSEASLLSSVRAALRRVPSAAGSPAAVARELAGSPPPLAALHRQASELLPGATRGLLKRIRALRGRPTVVNAWESYCVPCRAEFGLFASAAATFGRRVAFLGADANDAAADGRAFLAQHPVSYPSYGTTTSALSPLGVVEGFPTTFFIDASGRVTHVHDGEYDSLGTLEQDISQYALER